MNKQISFAVAVAITVGSASLATPQAGWSAEIPEITVSVRKRAESKQDIPMSIEAYTAEDLERKSMVNISDLAVSTPGLTIEQQGAGGFVTPVIRGMAQNVIGTDLSYDNNVGIFVNGVYQSGRNSVDLELIGIDRVEVARGPQSALYGRSSFAGAINYVYGVPSDELEGNISATYGSDDDIGISGDIGGPLIGDVLSGRISAGYRDFDGTFGNLAGGGNVQGYESKAAAGALVFMPNDDFTITLNGLYSDRTNEQDAQFRALLNCGDNGFGGPTYFCGDFEAQGDVDISGNGFADAEVLQLSLKMEYETEYFTLTSLTGVTDSDYNNVLDRDYGSVELGTGLDLNVCVGFGCFGFPPTVIRTDSGVQSYAHAGSETDDISQEFRITSAASEGLTWMAGAFFYESDTSTSTRASLGNDQLNLLAGESYTGFFAPPFLVDDPFTQSNAFNIFSADTSALALFAQVGFDFGDFNLTTEGRYTTEDKETHITFNFAPTNDMFRQTFSYFTPRFTLSWEPSSNEDVLVYASAAKGVRTGGINGGVTGCSPFGDPMFTPPSPACLAGQARERFFDPEENWTYEIGSKITLFSDRLQINSAVYYTDWEDMQLPALNADGFGTHVVNVDGGADIYGLEIDGTLVIADMVTLTGGYAYTKPEFKSGTLDGSVISSCGTDGSLCDIVALPSGLTAANVGGNTLGRTAEHQLNLGLLLDSQIGSGGLEWYVQTNLNYQSENYARSINAMKYGERTLVDARFAILNESYEIALWAKNLFDDEYISAQALQPGLDGNRRIDAYQGNGRRFGLTGTWRF